MVFKQSNCFRYWHIARRGVVQVVQEKRDLGVFELPEQLEDAVN
jgi:hypothetical protein